jgi:hypothetical protein
MRNIILYLSFIVVIVTTHITFAAKNNDDAIRIVCKGYWKNNKSKKINEALEALSAKYDEVNYIEKQHIEALIKKGEGLLSKIDDALIYCLGYGIKKSIDDKQVLISDISVFLIQVKAVLK